MQYLLEPVGFSDPARVRREVADHFPFLSEEIQAKLSALLSSSPDPQRAFQYLSALARSEGTGFDRFTGGSALQHLVAVFSYSHFLSGELLQNPQWILELDDLNRVRSTEEYVAELHAFLESSHLDSPLSLKLALFRRQQILRILLRDVLGHATLADVTTELSNVADAILETGYIEIRKELVRRHGTPRYVSESGEPLECCMSVIALGKLGGEELNYSSDIDLMFLYRANGETDGAASISNKEFYKKLATQYTALLSTYTAEGLCYRVDLRLRPEGSLGEVVISLEGAERYYKTRARDWELQMLIKARVAAGDHETGTLLLETVEPLTYSTTLDFSAVEAVSLTRERIGEKLRNRRSTKAGLDVKLAPGGIRDIEFLVQCLQRLHGGRVSWVRHGGTMHALTRLNDKNLLSGSEYAKLASAYQFLRDVEHRLQFEDDRQTHTLPLDSNELDRLARKMPAALLGAIPNGEEFMRKLREHLDSVQEIYARVIHAQAPLYYTLVPHDSMEFIAASGPPAASNAVRVLDERAPQFAYEMGRTPLQRGVPAFEHFLEKILGMPERLAMLNGNATLARQLLDIFEHSPYYSDELIRNPELMDEIGERDLAPDPPVSYTALCEPLEDAASLRRFFRREMFRLQAASLCLRVPVFETLARTSELADAAIATAYRLAVGQVLAAHPPVSSSYLPDKQMMVIALGRLGLREFDMASDADLVFVLTDHDQSENLFWTRVAERMVNLVGAYTGEGFVFTVDTRLRPNGGGGALVQSENAYKEYFDRGAAAWEGLAYMKTRAVAGDIDRATKFLNELQQIDWRRYGQSGRSKKDLRQMRIRLEREQGAANPLKAGQGGFYDVDFMLLYLRLKAAGIFYPVLNTPDRIDIIEKMGHLERADAEFLQDAATFYRAVDHGLRLASGHPEGNLPSAELQLENLTELVRRWTPEHLSHLPLPTQLLQIRNRTRDLFDRLFS